MNQILESSRLYFRQFQPQDAELLYKLNSDPLVMQYTGDNPFESVDEARSFVANYDHYDQYGFGRWSVLTKTDDIFLGWCGLKQHPEGYVDIGLRLFRDYWGQGFGTEAAEATRDYAFHVIKLPELIGRTSRKNIGSIRILEKIGMQFWKEAPCMGIPDALYYRLQNPVKLSLNSR